MNLSDNFTLAELTKSQTAVRKGIRGRKQILQAKKIEGKTVYEPILL